MSKGMAIAGIAFVAAVVGGVAAIGLTAAAASALTKLIAWCVSHGGVIIGAALGMILATALLRYFEER